MRVLEGKVAVVTGASSMVGIGAAIARRLAGSGANLLLVAEGPAEELEKVAAECRGIYGAAESVVALTADLGEAAAAGAIIDEALRRWDRIDMLVNNAGIRINKPFGAFTAEDFDRAVAVNLRAPFLASQAVLPTMRRQGGGRIVHIGSQFGSVSYPTRALYGLTKAALIHLGRSMALELAKENIQVNTISPGPVATRPVLERMQTDPQQSADRLHHVPVGRFGRPEEIAEVAHWLLTTDASFLIGHDLVVDGGYLIH